MTDSREYYFKEGCYIEEWLNSPDHEALSIARVRVEAMTQTRLHCLSNTTERYTILEGCGLVTVAEKSWAVEAGDVVIIEPGEAQKIANQTDQNLIFLAICTPRFLTDNYKDLES